MLNHNFIDFFFEIKHSENTQKWVLCRENMPFAEFFVNIVKIFFL